MIRGIYLDQTQAKFDLHVQFIRLVNAFVHVWVHACAITPLVKRSAIVWGDPSKVMSL